MNLEKQSDGRSPFTAIVEIQAVIVLSVPLRFLPFDENIHIITSAREFSPNRKPNGSFSLLVKSGVSGLLAWGTSTL